MSAISFSKYEGLGNDFIVIESFRITPKAAQRLCDRRRGVGADGVLSILPSRNPEADYRMHVFNADGSVAEMCGNGLRCVVRYLCEAKGVQEIKVDTDAGLLIGKLSQAGSDWVDVELGEARLIEPDIEVELPDKTWRGTGISMGNPHLVLDPFSEVSGDALMTLAQRAGPALERHPRFAARTNVEFVAPLDERRIELVVFERGAGITQACGTGAAASCAAMRKDLGPSEMIVQLPGGPLKVALEPARAGGLFHTRIIGAATFVFKGSIELGVDETFG